MPPKQSKADLAKKQKVVEDKTFGLKNKNKSKNVQKYVQSLKQNAVPKPDPKKLDAKKKKEEEKAKERELNELFKVAISQPKVPLGVDPKSILCEFFKAGQCAKGFKCKFSHDLNVQRKGEKIDVFSDKRDEDGKETMEDWDQETLEKVVASKSQEYNKNKPTDIVCKYFLEAVEKKQYGWFWVCPNGSKECHYRHALPPGYILKSQMKALLQEEADKMPIEEEIDEQRAKLTASTPLTTELFMEWKKKKMEEREASLAKQRADRAKNDRMSGRELFMSDASWFVDDVGAYDKYEREEESSEPPKENKESARDEASSSMSARDIHDGGEASHNNEVNDNYDDDDDDDDDDDLDVDELNELEASLSKTSLQINEPGSHA
ncbi:PREDICTED: zinc finger CCCH domain-containing protein 11 [Nicotiana attenuata]|uniref:Zinc finger ccch domain-containing protein 11 n=1 Tax=Nicotiana attenuata TaxID=49451 RepID=A0A1J6JCQ2_NICAT|nr:PREDICTED: zinc finger CCCH domain-containing protein 11 [Nicotiana attenuata]OIT08563.1 zinc finger ccch domain-containing protein 11 [Nicotiana attenuata]